MLAVAHVHSNQIQLTRYIADLCSLLMLLVTRVNPAKEYSAKATVNSTVTSLFVKDSFAGGEKIASEVLGRSEIKWE